MKTSTVLFNIGGHPYRVSKSLLDSQPNSMLTRIASKQWHIDESEIFIDRNGSRFQYVLDYLRDGRVILPVSECKETIVSELEYYNIDFDADYIRHSSQGQAADGLKIIQNTILKWRCADLAADCIQAAWDDSKWRGDKKYLSFEPNRFKDTFYNMKEKDIIKLTNEHLITLGVKLTSMEFDIGHEMCRATMQLIDSD
jgi:K+ channel tetramerisation domain.